MTRSHDPWGEAALIALGIVYAPYFVVRHPVEAWRLLRVRNGYPNA